jgi:hypothetical protein
MALAPRRSTAPAGLGAAGLDRRGRRGQGALICWIPPCARCDFRLVAALSHNHSRAPWHSSRAATPNRENKPKLR